MVALNFPTPTAVGQIYTAGVSSWQWDGTAWNIVPLITPPIADDDAPANPYPGQLWWNALNGNLYVWYVDANSAQWVQTAGNTGQVRTAQTRNRIVNPAFQISQELAKDTTYANGSHIADQWFLFATGVTGTAIAALRPVDNEWCFRMTSSGLSAPTAGALLEAVQRIEGVAMEDAKFGTVDAIPLVLRFRAKSTVAGTFGASYHNNDGTRSFVKNCVIAANVATDYVIPIPGDVTGTWPVGASLGAMVAFACSVGSTFRTATEGAWVAGNFFGAPGMTDWIGAVNSLEISRVGLHLDPDRTGKAPPFVTPDYAEELLRCKRYWQRAGDGINDVVQGAGAVTYRNHFAVPMRVPPGVTTTSDSIGNCVVSGLDTITDVNFRTWLTSSAAGSMYFAGTWTANARM